MPASNGVGNGNQLTWVQLHSIVLSDNSVFNLIKFDVQSRGDPFKPEFLTVESTQCMAEHGSRNRNCTRKKTRAFGGTGLQDLNWFDFR